jgi:hypothetical protein
VFGDFLTSKSSRLNVKNIVAFYLLIFYLLAVCKPVLPIAFDSLAHFFWKAHHISTVHHHLGKNHTEKQVASAAHHEENDANPSKAKIAEPVSTHVVIENYYIILQTSIAPLAYTSKVYRETSAFLEKYYPPPRCC